MRRNKEGGVSCEHLPERICEAQRLCFNCQNKTASFWIKDSAVSSVNVSSKDFLHSVFTLQIVRHLNISPFSAGCNTRLNYHVRLCTISRHTKKNPSTGLGEMSFELEELKDFCFWLLRRGRYVLLTICAAKIQLCIDITMITTLMNFKHGLI